MYFISNEHGTSFLSFSVFVLSSGAPGFGTKSSAAKYDEAFLRQRFNHHSPVPAGSAVLLTLLYQVAERLRGESVPRSAIRRYFVLGCMGHQASVRQTFPSMVQSRLRRRRNCLDVCLDVPLLIPGLCIAQRSALAFAPACQIFLKSWLIRAETSCSLHHCHR